MFFLKQVLDQARPLCAASALISLERKVESASSLPWVLNVWRLHSNDTSSRSFEPRMSVIFDKCDVVIFIKAASFSATSPLRS